jgi:ABC-type nitrate/sulfonate/bicarbonate transport system substrate-binding protein
MVTPTTPIRWAVALTVLLTVVLNGCAGTGPELPTLVFMAGYRPQANLPFVGVYVAEAQGFFEEEGLRVDVQHSTGGGEHMQLLVSGKVHVTTQDASVLLKRRASPGLPLVSLALIGQRGQQAFVAVKEGGPETLDAWKGRSIGFKGTPPPDLLALLDEAGLDRSDVEMINVGFDPRVLVEGLVDVYPVFASNEPYLLESWGYELRQWEAADYGIPTLGLTYVTTEETIAEDSEALGRFVRAAMRGIRYAEAHPDRAVEIVLSHTGPETDPAHMRYMLTTELDAAHSPVTDAHGLGWQTKDQWQALLESLITYEAIEGDVNVDQVYTNRFLESSE